MKQRVFITSLITIFISSILIAFLVLPRGKSQILLNYYSKDYETPLEQFQALYDQGDHTLSVINPLVQLYLDHADAKMAIQLLETFNRENPDRKDVLKSLSELYRGADMPSSNLAVNEELYKLNPNQEKLEFLIAQCAYMGQKEKWEKYLTILTHEYRANPDAYENLALYYAAKGQLEEAIKAVDRGLELCEDYSKCSSSSGLKVSILLDQGRVDQALSFSREFLHRKKAIGQITDLVQIFLAADHPREALELFKEVPEKDLVRPEVINAKIQILNALGEKQELLALLLKLHQEGKLDSNQYQTLISLGLDQKMDPQQLKTLLTPQLLQELPEDTWYSLIEWASESEQNALLERLKNDIPEHLIVTAPLLRYVLEMSGAQTPSINDLSFYLRPDLQPMGPEDSARYAIFLSQMGLRSIAIEEIKALPNFDGISISLIPQLASLYWEPALAEEGYARIDAFRSSMDEPSTSLMSSWAALSVLTDRHEQTRAWLELEVNHMSETDLMQVYEASLLAKNAQIARYTAERLQEKYPSPITTLAYANALILNKEYERGIGILKQLESVEPPLKNIHFSLLSAYAKASSADPNYLSELDHLLEKVQLKQKEWLSLGYALEEEGLKEQAIHVFIKLVESQNDSEDALKMVVYLFGEHLNQEQASWLIAQIPQSKGKQKGLILSSLVHGGYPEAVLESIRSDEWNNPEIFDSYLLAAAMLKKNDLVSQLIDNRLLFNPSIVQIRKWIDLLGGYNQFFALEALYLAILEIDPSDRVALRDLGNLYFDEGAFSRARYYLSLYLIQYEPDALSLFHYAELDQREGDYFHARPFYLAALNAPFEEKNKDAVIEIQALSYYRLNYPFTAIDLLEENLKPAFTGTFVNLLIDLDWTEYAAPYLFAAKDSLYIENLRSTWFMKTNEREDAFAQSDFILMTYPEEPYAWSARAQLEYEIGFYRDAYDDYLYASSLKPQDESLEQSIADIVNQHRSYTQAGWEYRKTGLTQKEHLWKFQHAYNLELNSRFLLTGEMDRFDINAYTNSQTGLTDSSHGNRFRFGLGWMYDFYCGWQSFQELYAEKHILGGGSHFSKFDLYGVTEVGAELRRPNWDFAETIVEYGSRDRIYVQRAQKLGERIEGLLKIEARRYHLQQTGSKAAESIAWVGDLLYSLPKSHWMVQAMGPNSAAFFNYNIDAEYGTWTKRRRNAEGEFFYPLNVGKREIHTMEMRWSKVQYRYCHFNAHFGFAYDRFGGVNKALAVYGGSLLWDKRPGLTFEIFYDHSPSPSVTGANEDRYMLNWIYYY